MAKIKSELLETDFYHAPRNQDLNAIRRQLAKAANQRMVRLERATSKISGQSYAFGAYDIAQSYLADKDRHRFSETMQTDRDIYEVIREITVLQKFLNAETSRVGGQKAIEKRRIDTFVKKGIAKEVASSKEFYDFLNSKSFEYLSQHVTTSEDIKDIYTERREAGALHEDIQKAFDEYLYSDGRKSYKELVQKINAVPVANSSNT